MIEGLKASIEKYDKLRWASLTIAFAVLFVQRETSRFSILGLSMPIESLLITIPALQIFLLLAKLVVAMNLADISKIPESADEAKNLISSYPLPEFMRWRTKTKAVAIFLSIFLVIADLAPAISLSFLWQHLSLGDEAVPVIFRVIYKILGFCLVTIAVLTWGVIRYRVYAPIKGQPFYEE